MAFVGGSLQDEDEDQKNNAVSPNGGGTASTGAVRLSPGNGVGSGSAGQASGSTTPTPGGSFASLNQYVDANQGQAQPLADKVTSGIGKQYNDLDAQNQQIAQNVSGQVNSGYTANNPDALAAEAKDPVSFSNDAGNVTNFQKLLDDTYSGPASAEGTTDFTDQQNAINSAISNGQTQTQTEAGRDQLLTQNEARPTAGVTALNGALLSESPEALSSIEGAYKPFGGLLTNLNNSASTIDQSISGAKSDAAAANAASNKAIADQAAGLNTNVGNETTADQAKINNYNSSAATGASTAQNAETQIKAYLAAHPQIAGTTDALAPFANLSPYTGAAPTNATSATAQDYATAKALQTLAGSTAPNLALDPTQADQAGKALPANFSDLLASLNGLPAAENSTLGSISSGLGTASQPALDAVKQLGDFTAYQNAAKAVPLGQSFVGANGKSSQASTYPILQQDLQTRIGQEQAALKNAGPHTDTSSAKKQLAADQAELTQVGTILKMPGAQNNSMQQKLADAQTVGGGQWINGGDTGFNSLLTGLGSNLAPVTVNTLPTQAQVTPDTSKSGFGGFGSVLDGLGAALAPVTLGSSALAAKAAKKAV